VKNILVGFKGCDQHPQKRDEEEQANQIDQRVTEQGLKKIANLSHPRPRAGVI
jgi:hypothetical protein